MFKSNRGQLSIFLGITLVLVMSMLAFIINVGLFVKAKINLQNAVDASAFAGASVQSRQLTNIAYLNWEMRNNYKEWMFKYYILGQLSSLRPGGSFPLERSLATGGPTSALDFGLKSPGSVTTSMGSLALGGTDFDRFNVPSICIHNSTATDICPMYTLPGLPRFDAIPVSGISEIHEAAVNELIAEKQANCSNRSKQNFEAAMLWAYGVGVNPANMPAILTADRPGAWPRALELGIRMRNLEMIVNLPPSSTPLTYNTAMELPTKPGYEFGYYERPYKAYASGFKNLSGGKFKEAMDGSDEFSSTFKLYELSPEPYLASPNSVSGFLIPSTSTHAFKKHYLDLQAMPLNLATMYSVFASTNVNMGPLDASGACSISKSAMPVPGFLMGFVKNPKVMTYYAVKGEAKFIGLFSPFLHDGIVLTAYASAKPFGGRIGPKLFSFDDASVQVQVRNSDNTTSNRSLAYVYGLKPPPGPYIPGDPIPMSTDFWLNSTSGSLLGGIPSAGTTIRYGIPNLIYDYEKNNIDNVQSVAASGPGQVKDIIEKTADGVIKPDENVGLYGAEQFKKLKASLNIRNPNPFLGTGGTYSSKDVFKAIVRARQPTKYDVLNYLVPDYQQTTPQNNLPAITETGPNAGGDLSEIIRYKLFAPLSGPGLLYNGTAELETAIGDYLLSLEDSVLTYEFGLWKVANTIYNIPVPASGAPGAGNINAKAAEGIHIKAGDSSVVKTTSKPLNITSASCMAGKKVDIASLFNYFFQTGTTFPVCGITPLKAEMVNFMNRLASSSSDSSMYFHSEYYYKPGGGGSGGINDPLVSQYDILSAYQPGERQGVVGNTIRSPLGGTASADYGAGRNFYSTKFFRMATVFNGPNQMNEPTLREELSTIPDGTDVPKPLNLLRNDVSNNLGGSFFEDF